MKQVTTFVGIDAHKKDLFVAMLIGAATTPVTWQLANEPKAVRRMVRKLERDAPGPVHVFYEAGPCGYALQRQMTTDADHVRRHRAGVDAAQARASGSRRIAATRASWPSWGARGC